MKSGRDLFRKWAEKDGGYTEYSPSVKLKILDFIVRSKDVAITKSNAVATSTYEVLTALLWWEDFLVKAVFKDLETNEEGWFYMTYETFLEKFGITKKVVKTSVEILKVMGWIETEVRFGALNGEMKKLTYYRIVQSKIADDAGIEK